MPHIQIDKEKCKGCELCVKACPQRVLALGKASNSKGYFVAEAVKKECCLGCRMCAITCPDVAIELSVHGTLVHYFSY